MAREVSRHIKCLPIMRETLELQVCATCLSIYTFMQMLGIKFKDLCILGKHSTY